MPSAPPCRAGGIEPGSILDRTTADAAKDLLPPEIHEHYRKGEYTNPIVDFPDSAFQWDDGFAEATRWNRENLVLDAAKQPVDKNTGKRPDYITGHPFPDIRENDPDAGVKVIWNTLYQVYNGGNIHTASSVDWVGRTAINRSRVSRIRTFTRKVEAAIGAGDYETARTAFAAAEPEIMRGVSKGVLHRNTASRKISRLSKRIKALGQPAPA